jgi:GTPase SAR1 family protein
MSQKKLKAQTTDSLSESDFNSALFKTVASKQSQQPRDKSSKMSSLKKWFSKFGSGKTEDEQANKEIADKLNKELKDNENSVTILLLGAGGSGKSTVLKQMEHLYLVQDDEKQMSQTMYSVHKNIVSDIYDLCKHYYLLKQTDASVQFKESDVEHLAIKIHQENNPVHSQKLTPDFAEDIYKIWNTETMKNVFDDRKKSHIMDNTPWFMDRVRFYADPSYKPSFDDYVRIRDQTTGVIISEFPVTHGNRSWLFKITDVGGQRAERKKWIRVFGGIDVVIYVMSLSAYDQVLYEDHQTRCWDETLTLFEQTASNKAFGGTDFIIFLNKCDIFVEKIKTVPFTVYEPKFPAQDQHNGDKVQEWVKQQFVQRFYSPNSAQNPYDDAKKSSSMKQRRGLHFHVTCATDSKQIETVVRYVQIELIRKLMSRAALL